MTTETNHSFEDFKVSYRKMDGADKILFWVHFTVAPALMLGAIIYVFGWSAIVLAFGWLLWLGSRA
jgi:hypothetical protein